MEKEYHVFWQGNVWVTNEIIFREDGSLIFNVQAKDGKFRVVLKTFDFFTEKLSDLIVPTIAS
jgi:hypothetical protein